MLYMASKDCKSANLGLIFRSAKEVDGQVSLKCPNISSIYYDNVTFY